MADTFNVQALIKLTAPLMPTINVMSWACRCRTSSLVELTPWEGMTPRSMEELEKPEMGAHPFSSNDAWVTEDYDSVKVLDAYCFLRAITLDPK